MFFRLYTLKACPEGARHYCDSHRKLAFKVAVVVMDAVSEANDGLRVPHTNPSHRIPSSFLGYNANGQKGLEGATSWRLKHPASRYIKIKHLRNFRECFFDAREHRVNTKSFYFI